MIEYQMLFSFLSTEFCPGLWFVLFLMVIVVVVVKVEVNSVIESWTTAAVDLIRCYVVC